MSITRRDFLNGVALAIGATLSPAARAQTDPRRYPPERLGMRGSTDESAIAAHALRDGHRFDVSRLPVEGDVDVLVVGAGISGLAAAYFVRQRDPKARILILDNHDDFGGHARRCEMRVDGKLLISYGGSESIQSPRELWSETALALLRDLGVDLERFETAFHRTLYPDLGLSRGLLFTREAFGVDRLVSGDPTPMIADDIPPDRLNARSAREFISDFPLDARAREALVALYTQARDFWPRKSIVEKMALLGSVSYRKFLLEHWHLPRRAADTFQKRPHDFFAVGIDLLPAVEAAAAGYPGFSGLGLPTHSSDAAKLEDPYIYHFPDGNASIARLLVRRLIPGVAPGNTMEDIVTAPFDYSRLDVPGTATRLRLESTVVSLANREGSVDVGYVHEGELRRVRARHVVYAGYNMMLRHVMPELSESQHSALAAGVKAPLVYVKIAVRNWRPWVRAGVHEVTNTMGVYARLKLDYPVSLGNYRFARTPDEPIVLHLVHVPIPNDAKDQREAWRAGRRALLETSFAQFESHAFDELRRILGGSFDPKRDVAAVTVYRWAHGYAYGFNSLFDEDVDPSSASIARQPMGRVAIANSDAAMSAYAHAAIGEAARAVAELGLVEAR
ncbi:MAG TPA: NAD(P)-binding protein [Steroidobacteraceae bacterium]